MSGLNRSSCTWMGGLGRLPKRVLLFPSARTYLYLTSYEARLLVEVG